MKLKEVEVSKIKLFVDGKVTGFVKSLTVSISAEDLSCVRAVVVQKIPEGGGVFGGNIVDKATNCFLRSWKGNVIRLRSEGVAPEAIEEPEDDDVEETVPEAAPAT